MTSALAGSLRKTIGSALSGTFLPATLTRGTVAYPCRAIFENFGQYSGAGGALTSPDAKILILAATLATAPVMGDVIQVPSAPFATDLSFVILSMKDTVDAVTTDPAGAVWTVVCKQVPLQSGSYETYAALAAALGSTVAIYRSSGSNPIVPGNKVEDTKAIFTDGKSQGFNFNRAATYDEVLQNALIDATQLQVGDFIVGAHTYFVAAMEPLRPVNVVECNRIISLSRSVSELGDSSPPALPSQAGGSARYFGRVATTVPSQVDNTIIASGIPVSMTANAGRATGQTETPSGAPGPSRWRIYMPVSVFPKGSVQDRDYITDEEGHRHMISVAAWTELGYRVEAIREEF